MGPNETYAMCKWTFPNGSRFACISVINNNNNKIFQAISNCGRQKRSSQIFREVSGVFQLDFHSTKIVLSSSRGHRNFRGLVGFEAKDLTFEAKDFKMCPRGQGRFRGLHLCLFHVI